MIKKSFKLLALSALLAASTTANAKVVYLSATGSDENDGTTAQTAFATLTKAVDGLVAGDIVMVDGFINVTEQAVIENIANDGVKFVGTTAETCGFDGGSQTRLFNITNSTVSFNNLSLQRGYFEGTPGGGAIYQTEGTLTIENCIVHNNKTNYKSNANGGAIRTQNADLVIKNSEFYYNSAFRGGAIELRGGNVTIDHSVFTINFTNTDTGAGNGGAAGAAIAFSDVENTLITSCTVDSNTSKGHAGAFFVDGAKVTNFTVLYSALTNNTSGGHGGMMMLNLNTNPDLHVLFGGTTIAKNHNKNAAAAVFVESSGKTGQSVSFVNCTITANETKDNVGNNGGIGMFDKKTTLNVVNTILEGNWALGNNRYSDGWWKTTPVNVINSYVGYIYGCNGENGNYQTNYNIENSHFFTTLNGSSVMQSGISTEADCDGYCYPLYPGSEATTMGDPELAKTYGVEYDQKGNKIEKPYIGAVQLVLGDEIPAQQISEAATDIDHVAAQTQSGKASRYELYNLSGQKIGSYSREPKFKEKGTFILVEAGKNMNQSKKIINN